MATIVIRNVDAELHARLKAAARVNRRSMAAEVRARLRDSLAAETAASGRRWGPRCGRCLARLAASNSNFPSAANLSNAIPRISPAPNGTDDCPAGQITRSSHPRESGSRKWGSSGPQRGGAGLPTQRTRRQAQNYLNVTGSKQPRIVARISSRPQAPRSSPRFRLRQIRPSRKRAERACCPPPDRSRRQGALGPQPRGEQSQIRRAMPAADHFRLADERIDRTRGWRQAGEMGLRPTMDGVVLRIGERFRIQIDKTHGHARLRQVVFQHRRLFVGVAPPAHGLGGAQPGAKPRHVVKSDVPKGIMREHRRSLGRDGPW